MLALATLLDPDSDHQTRQLWQQLEEKCSLSGIKAAPYPHFSWAASENIEWNAARRKLDRIAHKIKPFKVRTAGLGFFNDPGPVLYVAITKEPHLLVIHQEIWKRMERNLIKPQAFYSPNQWMPHITIAQGDLNPQKLACAVQELAFGRLAFEINVTNISVIYHSEEGVGIKYRFELGK